MSKSREYIRDGRAPVPVNELTSRIMSSIKAKHTKPEVLLRKELWRQNIKGYRLHWKNAPGKPDISFPGKKVAIFVNGCFWHRCPICRPSIPRSNSFFWNEKFKKNTQRDAKKIDLLKDQGWKVLVIWECQIRSKLSQQSRKIRNILN